MSGIYLSKVVRLQGVPAGALLAGPAGGAAFALMEQRPLPRAGRAVREVELVALGHREVTVRDVVDHQQLTGLAVATEQAQRVALVGAIVRHLVLPQALLHSDEKEWEHVAVLSQTEPMQPIKNQDGHNCFQQHNRLLF